MMLKKTILFHFIIMMANALKGYDDIIITKNQTKIYCIDDKNVEFPIVISPPLPQIENSIIVTEKDEFWKSDDWKINNSTDSLLPTVLDRRWSDFPLENGTYFDFLHPTSVSFSIYGSKTLNVFMSDANNLYLEECLKTENENGWNNFVISVKKGKIFIQQNGNDIYPTYDMVPNQIVIRSNNNTMFYKIHKYSYKEATQPSKNATFLTIPPMEKSLLIIYVSMCNSCILEITVNGKIFSNASNENSVQNEWQIRKISIDPKTETQIQLNRKVNGSDDEAFWALDVRLYDNQLNTACENGTWGIDCRETCSSFCDSCDVTTGECSNQRKGTRLLLLILALLALVVIFGCVLYNYRNRNPAEEDYFYYYAYNKIMI